MATLHEILHTLFGDRFAVGEPLSRHTSARVGGLAEFFVEVKSADELQTAASLAYQHGIPYFVLGGGSNILIADKGVSGLVIHNRAKGVRFRSNGVNIICTAESGANLSALARQCISKGLAGLEWAVSVPGTIGGAVFGNSGAHGSDMQSNLRAVRVWVPEEGVRVFATDELNYGYRTSALKEHTKNNAPRPVILSAELQLATEAVSVLSARAEAFITQRKNTQPGGASLGSMFKNPPHYYAGYLIEAAGLKGTRMGGVHVSEKHANFFINDESASAEDIRALLAEVWNSVRDTFGVELEPEVELVGNWEFNNVQQQTQNQEEPRDE